MSHIKPSLGNIKLEKLNVARIQMLINDKFTPADGSKGLSRRTVKYIKQTLHTALQKAKAVQLISYNPAEDVELPKDKEKTDSRKSVLSR